MTLITSQSNPTIKSIRKLANHKERIETGRFLVEGLRIVAEALQVGMKVETIIYAPELLVSEFGLSLIDMASQKSIPLLEVSSNVFQNFSYKEGPQGIAAVVKQNWCEIDSVGVRPGDVWIGLESVQNPGNLGSIMRTAEATGAKGVILLDQSTDPYDPSSVKASMGALFSLQLVKSNHQQFSLWIDRSGIQVIGTSDKAETDYMQFKYPDPCLILMGSERQGLPDKYLALCDQVVRIPMEGRTDSLNLAIAASLVIYQAYNQHRLGC